MEEGEDEAGIPYVVQQVKGVGVRPVLSVANYISLDVECVVAGSSDRSIRFLDTDSLEEVAKCTVDKKSVSFVAVSEMSPEGDDPVIATGGKDSTVQIWDPTSGSVDKSLTLPTTEIRSLSIYQGIDLLILMVGCKDGHVYVWDVKNDNQIAHLKGHRASVHCVCIAAAATSMDDVDRDMSKLVFASGGADRTVRTWDIKSGKKLKKFRHIRSVSSMVVTNRGVRPLLATAGVERVIKLWDLNTGVLLRSLEGHLDQINTLALWEGLQMLLISGSSDTTIRVFDLLSGDCICILCGHTDAVLSLAITNASDPKIVSSSEDLSLIQWDLNKVLADFYYSDDAGDRAGMRNERPPWLPEVDYDAPEELDREALSKDERKRIRKERKKEKRKRNLSVGLRASFTAMSDDQRRAALEIAALKVNLPDRLEFSDDEDEEDVRPAEGARAQTTTVKSDLLLQVMEKSRQLDPMQAQTQASLLDRPGTAGSTKSTKSTASTTKALSRPPSITSLLPRSGSGRIITDWVKKALGINSAVVPLNVPDERDAIQPVEKGSWPEAGGIAMPASTVQSSAAPGDTSPETTTPIGGPPSLTEGKMEICDPATPLESEAAAVASEIAVVGFNATLHPEPVGFPHNPPVPKLPDDVNTAEGECGEDGEYGEDQPDGLRSPVSASSQTILTPMADADVASGPEIADCIHIVQESPLHLGPLPEPYSAPAVDRDLPVPTEPVPVVAAEIEEPPSGKSDPLVVSAPLTVREPSAATLELETSPAQGSTAPPSVDTDATSSTAVSTPFSPRLDAQLQRTRQGSMIKEEDFKAKARSAQSNFAIASIERQLEVDRQKSKAAEKLQQRLMLKNKLVAHTHTDHQAEPTPDAKPVEDIHSIKAEKLKQHKLQENRRKQSMAFAQQRSADALQKRLEELAKKKLTNDKGDPIEEAADDGATSSSDDEQ